jgi:type I restriction enzyme S subunit
VTKLQERIKGRLGDLLPLKYGKSLPAAVRDSAGSVPVYGSSGVVGNHSAALTKGPVIIVGRKGNVGAVHYSAVPCWPIDTAYFAEPPIGHDPRYYRYLLDSLGLARLDKSTAIPGLSRDDYNAVDVVIHPPEQQAEIVAEIEKQFSRLDEAVANLQRVKANLKRYKASVLKAAVEGRLVETEASIAQREGRSYETGEQLLQRTIEDRGSNSKLRRSKADLATLPTSNLREVSDGWVWTTTGQVCECIVPNRDKPKTFSGDIPWLTLPDFDDSEITIARSRSGSGFTESEVELYRAKAIPIDSVVMSCVGRFGISAVLTRKAVINQQLHAFLPSGGVVPKYLAYVLRTREQEMLQKSTATTIAYLNKENCNSITVPLPPLVEQDRIVAEVDRLLSIAREVEAEVDANFQRAQVLRQAILSKQFSV